MAQPPDIASLTSPAELADWIRTVPGADYRETGVDVSLGSYQEALRVRWACLDVLKPGEQVHNRKVQAWCLKYVVEGAAELATPQSPAMTHTLGPHMVAWAGSRADTDLRIGGDRPLRNYTVLCYGQAMAERFKAVFPGPVGCLPVSEPGMIEGLFAEVYLEARQRYVHRQDSCAALLGVLLNRLSTVLERPAGFAGDAQVYFKAAQDYIEANYQSIRTVADIARYCGITPQYLIRVFKGFANKTPYQYLTELRLYHARELLLNGSHPMSQVARAVGYEDAKLFSRNFKKAHGQPPRDFRANQQGEKW